MILNSNKTYIVIIFPQNIIYTYGTGFYREDKYCELKNMLKPLKSILCQLYPDIEELDIVYENTVTDVGIKNLDASFYFNGVDEYILTKSVKSNKATTIGCGDVILSTLCINNCEELIAFLRTIGLIQDKQDTPKWMEDIKMFDDNKQLKIIKENNDTIRIANSNISRAMDIINKNNEYKSILYTTGDELVRVVFEILESMLGCDLSEFQDKKKEDFNFIIDGRVFIGEIKGVTPNVKNANVSQLDVHVQEYLDNHEDTNDNIVALLIINHQRNKALSERETVHNDPIRIAERNGSLIIETITLLKLFEKYLCGEKTREECIKILIDNVGLLSLP